MVDISPAIKQKNRKYLTLQGMPLEGRFLVAFKAERKSRQKGMEHERYSTSARQLRFSASGACLHALAALLAFFATGLMPVSAQNDATNRPPVQTFYLPIPEEDLLETLTTIHGGANWTLPAELSEGDNLDFGYFHMQATPPYNTAEIKLNGDGARFFKIRVDNLANEVR